MRQHEAEALRAEVESAAPGVEVTAVPWDAEGPRDEWIVSIWDADGEVVADIFGIRSGYTLRKPAMGEILAALPTSYAVADHVRFLYAEERQ